MSLNEKSITKFTWRLFWRTLRRINYFPLFIAFLIIIFCFLFISLIQNELFLLYNDKGITLSIFTSILSGAIIFSLIEIFTKITTTIEKSSHELFYNEIFMDEGLVYIL